MNLCLEYGTFWRRLKDDPASLFASIRTVVFTPQFAVLIPEKSAQLPVPSGISLIAVWNDGSRVGFYTNDTMTDRNAGCLLGSICMYGRGFVRRFAHRRTGKVFAFTPDAVALLEFTSYETMITDSDPGVVTVVNTESDGNQTVFVPR